MEPTEFEKLVAMVTKHRDETDNREKRMAYGHILMHILRDGYEYRKAPQSEFGTYKVRSIKDHPVAFGWFNCLNPNKEMLPRMFCFKPGIGWELEEVNCEYWLEFIPNPGTITEDAHEKEMMMAAFAQIHTMFEMRSWIMEGRGSYPYDDDGYKEEVRYLYDEFKAIYKNTWAAIQSKTYEYRNKIIDEWKKATLIRDEKIGILNDNESIIERAKQYADIVSLSIDSQDGNPFFNEGEIIKAYLAGASGNNKNS